MHLVVAVIPFGLTIDFIKHVVVCLVGEPTHGAWVGQVAKVVAMDIVLY